MAYVVGIRREDKSFWERRVPLPPQYCKQIMEQNPDIRFIVQPSSKRIFSEIEYQRVGCTISEDLSPCTLVACLKEIPIEKFLPNRTYLFWSCVTKGEPHNLPMLDRMNELKIRHIDYEKIFDDQGRPLVAFPFAGIAGVINILSELGRHLLKQGISNPFLYISPPYQYANVEHAYSSLKAVGQLIVNAGISKKINLPFIVGVIGSTGNCGKGALEALTQLPHKIVQPEDLEALVANKDAEEHQFQVYVVALKTHHLVKPKSDSEFNSQEYYANPQNYESIFGERYLPYLSVLVSAIFWESRFPRNVTKAQVRSLAQQSKLRLQAIADISCDLNGNIELMSKYTTPENPVYYYDPISETPSDVPTGEQSIMYMSIHFLPSLLPLDASNQFGKALVDIIPVLARSGASQPLANSGLPQSLQNAVLCQGGKLTDKFQYIDGLRKSDPQVAHHGATLIQQQIEVVVSLVGSVKPVNQYEKELATLEHVVNVSVHPIFVAVTLRTPNQQTMYQAIIKLCAFATQNGLTPVIENN